LSKKFPAALSARSPGAGDGLLAGAHASTFGGSGHIAAALATVVDREQYLENARCMGEYLLGRLASWREQFRSVGDVRGKGLMIGIELVKDQQTKEAAPELREAIVQKAFHKGLLVLGAGESTIRLCPPLVIDREQADFALAVLAECLREEEKSG
jgi:4-aminobutyrate aminotransferase